MFGLLCDAWGWLCRGCDQTTIGVEDVMAACHDVVPFFAQCVGGVTVPTFGKNLFGRSPELAEIDDTSGAQIARAHEERDNPHPEEFSKDHIRHEKSLLLSFSHLAVCLDECFVAKAKVELFFRLKNKQTSYQIKFFHRSLAQTTARFGFGDACMLDK